MSLASRADFLKEALPYCVDPESFMVLDPLRRKVCLVALDRARSKALAHARISSLQEVARALSKPIARALEYLIRRLVDPALCYFRIDEKDFLCCLTRRSTMVDERVIPAHSLVSLPLESALPGLLANDLHCNFLPVHGEGP